MNGKSDPGRRLTAAAMELAAIRPWHEIGWREIASAAGLTLDQAHALAPTRNAILDLLSRQADRAILAAPAAEDEGSVRDRLFDVAMRRFDFLKPYRAGLASVAASAPREPAMALTALCGVGRASQALLLAAAVPAEGLRGALAAQGLGVIWLAALRTFLKDESEDLSATMATLDKQLTRAESLLDKLTPRRRRAAAGPAEGAAEETPPL